jgi:hypothetical protein
LDHAAPLFAKTSFDNTNWEPCNEISRYRSFSFEYHLCGSRLTRFCWQNEWPNGVQSSELRHGAAQFGCQAKKQADEYE